MGQPADELTASKEYTIPSVLIAVGVAIYLIYAFFLAGMAGVEVMMRLLPVRLAVQVGLGIIACFVTAKIMGISFGYLSSAIVKLAAVFVFPSAATIFIPLVGGLVSMLLVWGLLVWLFELEGWEPLVLMIVSFVVNFLAIYLVGALGFALH